VRHLELEQLAGAGSLDRGQGGLGVGERKRKRALRRRRRLPSAVPLERLEVERIVLPRRVGVGVGRLLQPVDRAGVREAQQALR
jgi:hypothetical protein